MKLFVILLFTGLMQVHASVYSQKITLRQKNVSIETVLKAIEKQSDYLFLYDNLELQSAAKISVDINEGSIEQVMDLCLKNQPLTYKVFEKNIVLKRKDDIEKNCFRSD
ncbi:STN domain-containing protein [Pedobacter sp. NJ-S-72]